MQTLTEFVMRMGPPGGLFDETVIRNAFPHASEGARKLLVYRAVGTGEVIRLKPGLFVLGSDLRRSEPHPFVLAAAIHSPSHVSLQSALAYHGLIPEAAYQVSSVTVARGRTYRTPLGVFSFERVPARDPRAGVEAVKLGRDAWAFVATPLRAIADLVYLTRNVAWSKDGLDFLTDSLRMEKEDLAGVSFVVCEQVCRNVGDRRTSDYLRGMRKELNR